MWAGVFPAVTSKFTASDVLDHAEMERCFQLQIDAGVDGIIVSGSLGEGPMLSGDEKIEVLKTAQTIARKKPVLLTINEPGTREAAALAKRAAKAGANGLMVVPSPIYHTNPEETVAALSAVAEAGDLPVMVYSNRLAYRVDVTVADMEELAKDKRFVAIKESSDDIRRTTEIINRLRQPLAIFSPASTTSPSRRCRSAPIGWVAGLVTAFPKETVAIYQLMKQGRREEALENLPLVPPAARPRCVDLSGAEHQAGRSARHRHQRSRAHAAPAAVRRTPQGGRKGDQGRAGRAAEAAEALRAIPGKWTRFSVRNCDKQ